MSSSSSSSGSSNSLFTPLQFTGISKYSTDFQSILSRATSIASLPVLAMQNRLSDITGQEIDLTTLGVSASAVGKALQALGNLSSGGALSATSSDTDVVTATNVGAAAGTSFKITKVTAIASAASEISAGFSNSTSAQVSTTGTIELINGDYKKTITLTAGQNNLKGIADAINGLTGSGVTASVLTTGGTNGYYLSITANSPGATTLQLIDGPTSPTPRNLLSNTNQGSNTEFELNGAPVSLPSTSIDSVIPGLILKFKGTTSDDETVNVNVATDPTQISSALQTLVTSYNALATQETGQTGTGGGSLNGNSIIYQIRQAMSSIVNYQGSDTEMGNLANLGIEMSTTGQMSFKQETFDALSSSQITAALKLLGTATSGIGGLRQTFDAITNSSTGTIATQENQWKKTASNLTAQINAKIAIIQANEQTFNQQLQAADALIAELESQQSILTASITSLDFTSFGYNTDANATKST